MVTFVLYPIILLTVVLGALSVLPVVCHHQICFLKDLGTLLMSFCLVNPYLWRSRVLKLGHLGGSAV